MPKSKFRSTVAKAMHETFSDLHHIGLVDMDTRQYRIFSTSSKVTSSKRRS